MEPKKAEPRYTLAGRVTPSTGYYFAYGSNMWSPRLRARAPSARVVGPGHVADRTLAFDKAGRDGSGKCDMRPAPHGTVFGVLFEIAVADEVPLDAAEGLGDGYRRERVLVATPAGAAEAFAYRATHHDPSLRPFHWYKALVVAGAEEHGLPPAYVARLRAVPSVEDPDPARRAAHEALLTPRAAAPRRRRARPRG